MKMRRDGTAGVNIGRRGFIKSAAVAPVALVAGCADPQAVLVLDEATDDDFAGIAREVRDGTDEAETVAEGVEDGSYVTEGRVEPLDGTAPVLYDGVYYDVTVDVETVGEDVEYAFAVEYVGDEAVDGEVGYDELPDVDREALDGVLPPEDAEPEGFEGETGGLYTENEVEESVLVTDADAETWTVVVNGARFSVEVRRGGEPVERHEYRYRFEEVADTRAGFVDWALAEYVFELEDLSDEEEAIVEEAIEDGYHEGTVEDAFVSLVERFRGYRAVESEEWGGEWLVDYDGTEYVADLRHPPRLVE